MLRVTWEWIAIDEPALDLANTIAVENGTERDLFDEPGRYERWVERAATAPTLTADEAGAIAGARERLLALREPIREVITATAAGRTPSSQAVDVLNRASRRAPQWLELDAHGVREETRATAGDRLLARYARSAMAIAAEGKERLRRCPAPSCGMFYRPTRRQQRWCSQQCGTRARFARHYRAHRA